MQALGFHVWVAELELLVGQARGASKQPGVDPVAAVELLQKLQATIESAAPGMLRQYQRRCEEALADILLRGTAPPVGACTPEKSMLHACWESAHPRCSMRCSCVHTSCA